MSRGKVVSRDENGRAVRIAGTDTGITEMKRAEARQAAEAAETYRLNLARFEHVRLAAEEAQSTAAALALQDSLTGLPNRRAFMAFIETATRTKAHDQACPILTFDLDGFSAVNDIHGQHVGDAVLRQVAARTRSVIGADDSAMRIGPDEYAVTIKRQSGSRGANPATDCAQRLAEALAVPFSTDADLRIEVGVAIGVTDIPADSADPEAPLRAVGLAMGAARRAPGTHTWREFHSSMDDEMRTAVELEGSVRAAVESGHICPHFQPILDLKRGRLAAFEVLSRWTASHPRRCCPGYLFAG